MQENAASTMPWSKSVKSGFKFSSFLSLGFKEQRAESVCHKKIIISATFPLGIFPLLQLKEGFCYCCDTCTPDKSTLKGPIKYRGVRKQWNS